jgi:hypothetical protein
MSKHCSLCAAPKGVQNKILEWRQKGKSQRDIENALSDLFDLKISHTAIGRHLKWCLHQESSGEKEEEGAEDLAINFLNEDDLPPENGQLHQELCKILTNMAKIFNKRMRETASKSVPYAAHLESVRALDILINAFGKLYINPKEEQPQNQQRADLTDLQLKIIHDVITEPEKDNPEILKTTVLKVFENHQQLSE